MSKKIELIGIITLIVVGVLMSLNVIIITYMMLFGINVSEEQWKAAIILAFIGWLMIIVNIPTKRRNTFDTKEEAVKHLWEVEK